MSSEQREPRQGFTRRGLLAAGGAAILGAAGGYALATGQSGRQSGTTAEAAPSESAGPATTPPSPATPGNSGAVPFYGAHQAGVETAPALFQTFVGLNLVDRTRDSAESILRLVTDDAVRLTQGQPALGDTEPELSEHPDGLTITVGLGRQLLEGIGFGDRIPPQLPAIPAFSTDVIEEPWEQTDLLLQVGSNNSMTLAHTIRMLTKDLSTLTRVQWLQEGFRSPAPANPGSTATRNLMGQVDGTINPRPGSPDFDEVVWLAGEPQWYSGGTVLVLRRIRMLLDTWDALDRAAQETVIGRMVTSGAPLGGTDEREPVPFDAVDAVGLPVIPQDAHIRVAHAATTGEMILRRPYNYDSGMRNGTSDVGLLFAAYMRDPSTSFIPMQRRIAESDAFNRWNATIGSAAYLLPGGVRDGGFLAEGLFA